MIFSEGKNTSHVNVNSGKIERTSLITFSKTSKYSRYDFYQNMVTRGFSRSKIPITNNSFHDFVILPAVKIN